MKLKNKFIYSTTVKLISLCTLHLIINHNTCKIFLNGKSFLNIPSEEQH
jgi:hypothetical protein